MTLSPKARRRLLIAAIVVVIYALVGFVALPPIVKAQVEKRATALLGRRVTVETIRLNPFTLSVTLQNFAIAESDGTTRFVGWRRLYVNFDALGSLFGKWVLSDIELDGLYTRAVMNPDASLNFSDILKKLTADSPAPSAAPPSGQSARPVRVNRLTVTDARIEVTDRTRSPQFATAIGPLSFDLKDFQTVPEGGAPYRFEAVTESGEKFAWSGTLVAQPFQSEGEFHIENLHLPKYAPYYADRLQGDITSGALSLRGHYVIDLTENHRVMRLQDGTVQLRQFVLSERADKTQALELPALDVTGIVADALTLKATIASVAVNGGHVRVRRDAKGTINLLALLPPPATQPPAPAVTTANPTSPQIPAAPDVTIAEVAVKDFQADVTDQSTPAAAKLGITGLQLSLKQVTLAKDASMPIHLAFSWAPQGTVQLDGTVGINPVTADLKAVTTGFALLPLNPYVEQFANVHLTQGALTSTLHAEAAMAEGKPPSFTVSGDVVIDRFGVVDGARNEDLAGFGQLAIRGINARAGHEIAVNIGAITLAKPYARVGVAADGSLNIAAIVKAPPAPAEPVAAIPVSPATEPKIEIGQVSISDGDFRFADASVTPGVTMTLNQFGGTITGLSSTNLGKGDVDLKATVDGIGPVAVTGKLDPFGAARHVDLKVEVKNVDLLPLSPYTGKYAGYELARGKLFVDVNFKVDGRKIDAANVITLNQFTFGGPVQSADATKLPVRLAIALLKDTDGKIIIDVPIQGSTDDPDFKIGRVVLRVVVNLLTKAAVSPFSLLGAAFGGGGDELAYQEFTPGQAELQAAEIKKLETMVKALTNRPGLSVDLEGSYDPAADTYALRRIKLEDRIRRAIWNAKRQQDPNLPPPEKLTITAAENAAMVKQLFDQTFPPGTKFGTPVPPPPAVAATPAPPPGGWFKRIVRAITFTERREAKKAAAENARRAAEHEKAVAAAVASGLPIDEMLGRLAEATAVDANDLQVLARTRAEKVRSYLTDVGKIAPDRLFLAKTDATHEPKGPRVFLNLQ